jgi:hypothetical protein
VGIGIQKTNSGIGIPVSVISVRYRSKKMPDCCASYWYRSSSGIVTCFQSGTGTNPEKKTFFPLACHCSNIKTVIQLFLQSVKPVLPEQHHFYAAPGKNLDAAPAPTLPYKVARQLFVKSKKVNIRARIFYQWFSMIAIVVNMNRKGIKLIQFVTFFQNLSMFSIRFGAGAVGAGAASCYEKNLRKLFHFRQLKICV